MNRYKKTEDEKFRESSISFIAGLFSCCFFLPLRIVQCLSLPDKKDNDEVVDKNNYYVRLYIS